MAIPLILGLVGLGLSTATSLGMSIYNATRREPDVPGSTGEQRLGQSLLQARANELASMGGLSETEYNRPIEQAERQSSILASQGIERTRSMSPFISNVAAERIAKEFAVQSAEMLSQARREMTSLDIQAARENLRMSISAQQAANQQANEIARAERERAEKLEMYRAQKLQGIMLAAGQAASSMLKLVEIGSGTGEAATNAQANAGAETDETAVVQTTDQTSQIKRPFGLVTSDEVEPLDRMFSISGSNYGLSLFDDKMRDYLLRNIPDWSAIDMIM